MESAIKIASEIVASLPKDKMSPESTEKKEPFIHPLAISGGIEETTLQFIIRAFDEEGLKTQEDYLKGLTEKIIKNYPNSSFDFIVKEQYRNMKQVLDKNPEIVNNALEAIRRAGVEPVLSSIRGGTDGSRFHIWVYLAQIFLQENTLFILNTNGFQYKTCKKRLLLS